MGQVLHGSATTTEAVRRAIQHSQESLRALARRYGVNPKTIAKWKGRTSAADLPTGPKESRSTVLTLEEEAVVVAFRRHTLLPLDDCLYALQPTIPHLTRSSLHRCLQRHGISRLPQVEGEVPRSDNDRLPSTGNRSSRPPRCLVPAFAGAFLPSDSKDALWDRFFMGAPRRQRRSVERYSIVKRA